MASEIGRTFTLGMPCLTTLTSTLCTLLSWLGTVLTTSQVGHASSELWILQQHDISHLQITSVRASFFWVGLLIGIPVSTSSRICLPWRPWTLFQCLLERSLTSKSPARTDSVSIFCVNNIDRVRTAGASGYVDIGSNGFEFIIAVTSVLRVVSTCGRLDVLILRGRASRMRRSVPISR